MIVIKPSNNNTNTTHNNNTKKKNNNNNTNNKLEINNNNNTNADVIKLGAFLGNENNLSTMDVYNCAGCGLIYAGEDKRPTCLFCSRPLTGKTSKERKRRVEEGEDEEGLTRAMEIKNRLVGYDRMREKFIQQ
jgi:hypothetical protein